VHPARQDGESPSPRAECIVLTGCELRAATGKVRSYGTTALQHKGRAASCELRPGGFAALQHYSTLALETAAAASFPESIRLRDDISDKFYTGGIAWVRWKCRHYSIHDIPTARNQIKCRHLTAQVPHPWVNRETYGLKRAASCELRAATRRFAALQHYSTTAQLRPLKKSRNSKSRNSGCHGHATTACCRHCSSCCCGRKLIPLLHHWHCADACFELLQGWQRLRLTGLV